jgi:1-acyl-sn-glycerol-3-phosphate acyltransferase
MLKEKLREKWFWFGRWLCRIFSLVFFRLRVCGRENVPDKGAFILVCNHQSYLDPVFCGAPLKRHLNFVARDSLFKNWFFGWMISSVNTIPVKQGEADLTAMRKVINLLKEGKGVCLFPEGTRTIDGKITSLKPGIGLLCRRGDAAIVPALIDGAFECWPRHQKIFLPGSISVIYGETITNEQIKKMSDEQLANLLTDTLRQMQNDCRLKQGKKTFKY